MGYRYRVTKGNHEVHMIFAQNASGSTRVQGACVIWRGWDQAGQVVQPAAGRLGFVAGIAFQDMPDAGEYKPVVHYGYTYALVRNDTVTPIVRGDILIPVAGQDYLVRSSVADGKTGWFFAEEDVATSNPAVTALRKVFVRC